MSRPAGCRFRAATWDNRAMYLVHVALNPPWEGCRLPEDASSLIAQLAEADKSVQHITFHQDSFPDPVIGIYVQAGRLQDAEERSVQLCRRAAATLPGFDGWSIAGVEVPLASPGPEWTPRASGALDRSVQCPIRPAGTSFPGSRPETV